MTFQKFKEIVESRRPDVRVSPHGGYQSDGSKHRLGVTFIKNGRESRVYDYTGTYCEVLNKLGIPAVYEHDVYTAKDSLKRAKERHGTEDPFFGGLRDCTKEIAKLEAFLLRIENKETIVC